MKGIALLAYLSVLDLIGTRVLVCLIEGRGCSAGGVWIKSSNFRYVASMGTCPSLTPSRPHTPIPAPQTHTHRPLAEPTTSSHLEDITGDSIIFLEGVSYSYTLLEDAFKVTRTRLGSEEKSLSTAMSITALSGPTHPERSGSQCYVTLDNSLTSLLLPRSSCLGEGKVEGEVKGRSESFDVQQMTGYCRADDGVTPTCDHLAA